MPTKPTRIPLAQQFGNRGPSFSTDSYTCNVLFEKTDLGVDIIKRPGFTLLHNFSTDLVAISGAAGFGSNPTGTILQVIPFSAYIGGLASAATNNIVFYASVVAGAGATTPSGIYLFIYVKNVLTLPPSSLTPILPATVSNPNLYNYFPWTAGITYSTVPSLDIYSFQAGNLNTYEDLYLITNTQTQIISATTLFQGTPTNATSFVTNPTVLNTNLPDALFAPGVVYLDGYIFFAGLTSSHIYNTDLLPLNGAPFFGSITSPNVTATNFIVAYGEGGNITGISKHLNYLVCFKEFSTEFFVNGGNSTGPSGIGSPLSNYTAARTTIGCANGMSIQRTEQNVYWIGQGATAGRSLYCFNQLTPQKISTDFVDKFLTADGCFNIKSALIKVSGHECYVLQLNTLGITLMYDISTGEWHRVSTNISNTEQQFYITSGSNNTTGVSSIVYSTSTGTIVVPSLSSYTDDVNTFTCRSQTNSEDWGTRQPKTFGRLDVIADQQTSSTLLSISHSDDNFITYSTPRTVDLSLNRPVLFQGGRARNRAYKVEHTDNTPFRACYLELDVKLGS